MANFLKVLEHICKKDRDEKSLIKLSNDPTRERIDEYLKKRYEKVLHKFLIKHFPNSNYVKEERQMINRFCYEAIIDNNPWIMNYVLLDRRIESWYYEEESFNEMVCNILRCTFSSSFISILCEYEKGRTISLRSRSMRVKNLHKVYFVPLGDIEYTNPLLEAIKGKNNWAIEYLHCNKNYWNAFMKEDIELIYRRFIDRELGISAEELMKITKSIDSLDKIGGELKREFINMLIANKEELALKILFENIGKDKLIEECFLENLDYEIIKDKEFKRALSKIFLKKELDLKLCCKEEEKGSKGRGKI